ncbi:hypothetical protein ACLX1H_007941 [Fusarium chlamydosporum]
MTSPAFDDISAPLIIGYFYYVTVTDKRQKTDKDNAYVLHASFPEGILQSLDHPSHHTDATWPTVYVYYTKTPFEPYGTFADRNIAHLLYAKYPPTGEPPTCKADCVAEKTQDIDTIESAFFTESRSIRQFSWELGVMESRLLNLEIPDATS